MLLQVWESPALLIPLLLLSQSPGLAALAAHPLSKRTLLAGCFLTHYTYRTLYFPLATRNGKPAPLSVAFLGMSFCTWNGFLQGAKGNCSEPRPPVLAPPPFSLTLDSGDNSFNPRPLVTPRLVPRAPAAWQQPRDVGDGRRPRHLADRV